METFGILIYWRLTSRLPQLPLKKVEKVAKLVVEKSDGGQRIDCYFAKLCRDANSDLASVGWNHEILFGAKRMQVCYLDPVKDKPVQLDGSEKVFTLLKAVPALTLVLRCVCPE